LPNSSSTPREALGIGTAAIIATIGSRGKDHEIPTNCPSKCKPFQVKQVRNVIINYRLAGEADD
jgi:hypothetical protein